jgi:hypothetical protein
MIWTHGLNNFIDSIISANRDAQLEASEGVARAVCGNPGALRLTAASRYPTVCFLV